MSDVQQYEDNTQEQSFPDQQSAQRGEVQDLLFNEQAMNQIYMLAQTMSQGKSTVPNHLQGNVGDCMAVCMQAAQWKMNPFAVAQKTHVVQGTLGYEAQLVNAVVNTRAPINGRIQYEWTGEWNKVIGKFQEKTNSKGNKYIAPAWSLQDEQGLGVRVWATLRGEDEPRVLDLLLSQAQVRNSTLWASDPKQQLAYLAIKRWARLYCPDVILGVYTADEMQEFGRQAGERDITPRPNKRPTPRDAINSHQEQPAALPDMSEEIARLEDIAINQGDEAFKAAFKGLTEDQKQALGIEERNRIRRLALDQEVADD